MVKKNKKALLCILFSSMFFSFNAMAAGASKGAAEKRVVKSPTKVGIAAVQKKTVAEKLGIGPATAAVKNLDKELSHYRVGKLTEEDQEFNRALKKRILRGIFNVRELAKRALGIYWDQRTPEERDEFVELLITIMEEKSVSAKEASAKRGEGADYTVRYFGDKPLAGGIQLSFVHTTVYLPKEDLTVGIDYKLKSEGEEWRIYDVIVDGASLISNYRYSFQKIIKQEGYPELVARLRKKAGMNGV